MMWMAVLNWLEGSIYLFKPPQRSQTLLVWWYIRRMNFTVICRFEVAWAFKILIKALRQLTVEAFTYGHPNDTGSMVESRSLIGMILIILMALSTTSSNPNQLASTHIQPNATHPDLFRGTVCPTFQIQVNLYSSSEYKRCDPCTWNLFAVYFGRLIIAFLIIPFDWSDESEKRFIRRLDRIENSDSHPQSTVTKQGPSLSWESLGDHIYGDFQTVCEK